jgi:hypothetical protein
MSAPSGKPSATEQQDITEFLKEVRSLSLLGL